VSAQPRGRRARRARPRPPQRALRTVSVPAPFRPAFLRAQDYVARYFQRKKEDPKLGTISISGERYILLRAASMSVEFFDLVISRYQDKGPDEARSVAANLLFDLTHAIGKADAKTFHQRMRVTDPIERLSAGPIHFSFSGWAFVDIFPESRPSPDEDYYLIYEHPFSFESDAWVKRGRVSELPVCIMNAGYSSGWCEESFGVPLVSTEVECLAAGGRHCRFIMAPPSRIEEHLARYAARPGNTAGSKGRARGLAPVSIPEFFQRKRMEDELRQSHENLERRVEARTAELTAANERLRQEIAERRRAEEVRDEFLSVAAHELKTPMTSLRGFAQLLLLQADKGEATEPERLRQALTAIDEQSGKLSRLVGQLLDISRLEAGRLVLERKITDVASLVEDVVAAAVAAARATTSRHSFKVTGTRPVVAFVDPLRLEQVLTNLVDNAVKYSPKGGPIEIDVSKGKAEVRVAVKDRGIGVPSEHRARIFDRFYQAHAEHRLGGMGLGLYISRQIVDLHGGRLEARYPAGGGTEVVVKVPVGGDERP
jgi:signal transduction histidine kinase/predicted hydrocarbon binding protein